MLTDGIVSELIKAAPAVVAVIFIVVLFTMYIERKEIRQDEKDKNSMAAVKNLAESIDNNTAELKTNTEVTRALKEHLQQRIAKGRNER
jgi:hypothetical protein